MNHALTATNRAISIHLFSSYSTSSAAAVVSKEEGLACVKAVKVRHANLLC